MRDCLKDMRVDVFEGPVAMAAAGNDKRGRCGLCHWKLNKKGTGNCEKCHKFLCKQHKVKKVQLLCTNCADAQ